MVSDLASPPSPRYRFLIRVLVFSAGLVLSSLSVAIAAVITNITETAAGSPGALGTTVTDMGGGVFEIGAGSRSGTNLFHSFDTFTVGRTNGVNDIASFVNTTDSFDIGNIIARVLNAQSMIDGTISTTSFATSFPTVHLYLLNPRGIMFGPNAALDLNGSFYASTGEYLKFDNGEKFFVDPAAVDSVLSMANPAAFGFLRTTPGGITVEGSQLFALTFDPANPTTLALVGGAIDINSGATLNASGGNLLLAAAASSGPGGAAEVTLPAPDVTPEITGSQRLSITVSGGAVLDATDQFFGADGRGGTVYIRGGEFIIDSSFVKADNNGDVNGVAPAIDVDVVSMSLTGGATFEAGAFGGTEEGRGNVGKILLNASDTISVGDTSSITSSSASFGALGGIDMTAHMIEVKGGTVKTSNAGGAPANPLVMNADVLRIIDGGVVITEATTDLFPAGDLLATAKDSLLLSGQNALGERSLISSLNSAGAGGTGDVTVTVTEGSARIENGARVGGDLLGAVQSGSIKVDVKKGDLTITGRDTGGFPSAILNLSTTDGQSGPVDVIVGGTLSLIDGQIRSVSGATGGVGNATVTAGSLSSMNGRIEVGTVGPGDGGILSISTTGNTITLTGGSTISSSTTSSGNAGQIMLTSPSLSLNNSTITTSTSSSGNAGTITAKVGTAMLSNGATISSSSTGTGNAGSVTIQGQTSAANSVSLTNSTIATSAANTGRGGSIAVDATNLTLNTATVSASVKDVPIGGDPGVGTGNIALMSPTMTMTGGSIKAETSGSRNAGAITLKATTATLQGGATVSSASTGTATGNAGSVTIEGLASPATSVTVTDSSLLTSAAGNGQGGGIMVDATTMTLNNATVSASVKNVNGADPMDGPGAGLGNIALTAPTMTIAGSEITAETTGTRNAGSIFFNVGSLETTLGTGRVTISSSSTGAETSGNAGSITIQGTSGLPGSQAQAVRLAATDLSTAAGGTGAGGAISLAASGATPLSLTNTTISASVRNVPMEGNPATGLGNLALSAPSIQMTGGSLRAETAGSRNAGAITLITTGNSLSLSSGGTISSSTSSTGNAGTITISSPGVTLNDGTITTSTTAGGNAGSITANVGSLSLTGDSTISSSSTGTATGAAGSIMIQGLASPADAVTLTNSSLLTRAANTGQGGSITVDATNLTLNNATVSASVNNVGSAPDGPAVGLGNIDLTASTMTMTGGTVTAATSGTRNAGTVTITTTGNTLTLSGGGHIESSTSGSGDAGTVIINTPALNLNDSTITTSTSSSGDAGNIEANVGTATLTNNAEIASSSTGTATGAAGSVTIQGMASPADAVTLTNSALRTSAANTGQGGSITVDGTNLTLDNATVSASVNNVGSAPDSPIVGLGNIDLTASTMTMTGGTITAETAGTRNAGTVMITTTGNTLTLTNNAEISSSSTGTAPGSGKAGSVTLNAGDQFVSQNSQVSVGTEQADGGNITLNATTLIHLLDSQITATVKGGEGKGGNVSIDPTFVLLENSSITANAFGGPGGNINIVAGTFLMDPASSVTASSAFSAQGTVNIQSPVQNISTSLAPLPKNFASAVALLAERCAARAQDAKFSTFVVTGRDGVPPEPGGLLPSPLVAADSSGLATPTATGAIQAHADAVSVTGNSLASLGSGRFTFALADDACGK